jgi:chromosome segregation ATPase
MATDDGFRAAVDEARRDLLTEIERLRAEVETKTYVAGKNRDHHWQALDELEKLDAVLAAARAEIAAQAATITELRAELDRVKIERLQFAADAERLARECAELRAETDATIKRLTAENAQTGAELARFATEGEWTTEYSVTGRGYWEAERCHLDRFERQVWRGKARAIEGTTE